MIGDLDGDLRLLTGDLDGDLRLRMGDLDGDRRFLTRDRCCLSASTSAREAQMLTRHKKYRQCLYLIAVVCCAMICYIQALVSGTACASSVQVPCQCLCFVSPCVLAVHVPRGEQEGTSSDKDS